MFQSRQVSSALLFLCVLAGVFLSFSLARAEYVETFEWTIDAGYRMDELDWSNSGNYYYFDSLGNLVLYSVDVAAEHSWEDLEIYQFGTSGKMAVGNQTFPFLLYLRGGIHYGAIMDGESVHSDYVWNGRTYEYSRMTASTEDDHVWDASIAGGLQFKYFSDRISLAPLIGFSHYQQNLRDTNGYQVVSDDAYVGFPIQPAGPIPSLNQTYEAKWTGPWVGFDLEYSPVRFLTFTYSFEYHWADYEAEANWNVWSDLSRSVYQSKQNSDGTGLVISLGSRFNFTRHLALQVKLDYRDFEAKEGETVFLHTNGFIDWIPLNEANWESYSGMVGIVYRL